MPFQRGLAAQSFSRAATCWSRVWLCIEFSICGCCRDRNPVDYGQRRASMASVTNQLLEIARSNFVMATTTCRLCFLIWNSILHHEKFCGNAATFHSALREMHFLMRKPSLRKCEGAVPSR